MCNYNVFSHDILTIAQQYAYISMNYIILAYCSICNYRKHVQEKRCL